MRTFALRVLGSSTREISATLPLNLRSGKAFNRISAASPICTSPRSFSKTSHTTQTWERLAMVNRFGVLSRLLTPSKPATFCSTMVPETGALSSISGLGCAGSPPRMRTWWSAVLHIDFGFVFRVLGDFQIFCRNRSFVVKRLGAIKCFVGEGFVRFCFFVVRECAGNIRTRNHQQRLSLFDRVAEFCLEVDDPAGSERGHVDGAIHVRSNGPIRSDQCGQRARFGLCGLE